MARQSTKGVKRVQQGNRTLYKEKGNESFEDYFQVLSRVINRNRKEYSTEMIPERNFTSINK